MNDKDKRLVEVCITVIVCICIICFTVYLMNTGTGDNTEFKNTSDINHTMNNTTGSSSKTDSSVNTGDDSSDSGGSYADSIYEPDRDDSHQNATRDHPVTVRQSDGEYTYYGPGHFDYYAGDNHLSGEYYKYKTNEHYLEHGQ